MTFSFISLIIALIALILYFGERSKFLNKTDELTVSIQKEMEEKADIQSRYNTLVNDVKKEEEFAKSKKIDEMQLLFTKVNMLDDKLTYFNTAFKNKLDEIISLLGGDKSNFDSTENKIENFIPEEDVKITNTQDNAEIENNDILEETQTEIEEENKETEIEENQEETEEENEETDVKDTEENKEEQNQFNNQEITTDVLNDIKDTLEDGDVLEPTDKQEESTNYTDREFENFLNKKENDINFNDLDDENMDTLADVVKNNNEEKDFNDDLKLNNIDEGFDIKSSIEKLRAQLEQEDKK